MIWDRSALTSVIYCIFCSALSSLHSQVNQLLFSLTGISINSLEILFIYLFIFTLFTVDLKLLIYTKKSLCNLYSNNIELIDVTSVTEQEMQSFPKEFLRSMWTNWQTHTHFFTHLSKKHSKERLHSYAVSFLVFTEKFYML